jgi:transposase-like protein
MPAPHPPKFRQRTVELARQGTAPVSKIAKGMGISQSCRRNWMAQADTDENGSRVKLTSVEKKELAERGARTGSLRWKTRFSSAAAYFARENLLPK